VLKDQTVNLLLIVPRYDANQLHVCHTSMILQVGLQAIKINWGYCTILIWPPSFALHTNERLIRWRNLISTCAQHTFKPGDKIAK